jgi:hypothetical protein
MKMARTGMIAAATVAALALMILGTPVSMQAQSEALRATIPFNFHVGDKTLPAGTYVVEKRAGAIFIQDRSGHSAVALTIGVTQGINAADTLVFNRYGDKLFLSEVRWNGYSTGSELRRTAQETRLGSNFAPQTVTVAANIR